MQDDAGIFLEVFSDVPIPFFAADLDRLKSALDDSTNSKPVSHCALKIGPNGNKRAAVVASLRGILRRFDVPPKIGQLFSKSTPLSEAGYTKRLMSSASKLGKFAVYENGECLIWEEESLWPIAYSSCLAQFQNLIDLHQIPIKEHHKALAEAIKSKGFAPDNLQVLSEYPRQLPTRWHYAAASLGAWIGGATNVQYFACYASIRQIHHSALNLKYAQRIGYNAETSEALDKSGIIALPASLVVPLLKAQGDNTTFGSIGINEVNLANPPNKSFFDRLDVEKGTALPGFISDKYYRTCFLARPLQNVGLYGEKNELRDHYEAFYKGLKKESLVRCKHYCVPVVEVNSFDELRAHASRIPIHDKNGIFYRGQGCLYTLQRDSRVRQMLFADSCSIEPSFTTSASRDLGCDYERLHFAIRFYLEQKVLKQGADNRKLIERWREQAISPACPLDYAVMALAQHYGLPSHGLDITDSSDVAMWFATNRYHLDKSTGLSSYLKLKPEDWPSDPMKWPVIVACQCVTHSINQSIHDCHELAEFGFKAMRPVAQRAHFFQGGHSDHQNRLAEAVVCIFRLAPGYYETEANFDSLFPQPSEDPAYQTMIDFAASAEFGSIWGKYVNKFHG